jgi:hypothetical protein
MAVSSLLSIVQPSELPAEECDKLLSEITLGDVAPGFMSWRDMVVSGIGEPVDVSVRGMFMMGVTTDIVQHSKHALLYQSCTSPRIVTLTTCPLPTCNLCSLCSGLRE